MKSVQDCVVEGMESQMWISKIFMIIEEVTFMYSSVFMLLQILIFINIKIHVHTVKALVNLENFFRCYIAYFGPRLSIFLYMRHMHVAKSAF